MTSKQRQKSKEFVYQLFSFKPKSTGAQVEIEGKEARAKHVQSKSKKTRGQGAQVKIEGKE